MHRVYEKKMLLLQFTDIQIEKKEELFCKMDKMKRIPIFLCLFDLNMPTAFITGATGFVGAHLVRYLAQKGISMRLLKRSSSDLTYFHHITQNCDATLWEWVEGDLNAYFSLEEALEGISQVYHVGGFISFQEKDNRKMLQVNGEGTANLVNASIYKGISKFLYVSSIAALGRSSRESEYDETHLWKNDPLNSGYAVSKYAGEREVWRGVEEGLNAVIVNPSIVVGDCPWNEGSGRMFATLYKGMPFYAGGHTGFVDVEDVVSLMHILMEGNFSGERYILSAETRDWKSVFTEIAGYFQKKAPRYKLGAGWLRLAARIQRLTSRITGKEPLITPETARNADLPCHYPNRKIIEATGFQFKPVSETFARTAALYLESLQKKG